MLERLLGKSLFFKSNKRILCTQIKNKFWINLYTNINFRSFFKKKSIPFSVNLWCRMIIGHWWGFIVSWRSCFIQFHWSQIDILAYVKELMYKPHNEPLFFQDMQTEFKTIHVNNSYTGMISFYLVLAHCYFRCNYGRTYWRSEGKDFASCWRKEHQYQISNDQGVYCEWMWTSAQTTGNILPTIPSNFVISLGRFLVSFLALQRENQQT